MAGSRFNSGLQHQFGSGLLPGQNIRYLREIMRGLASPNRQLDCDLNPDVEVSFYVILMGSDKNGRWNW
jgi:hypothetical protein